MEITRDVILDLLPLYLAAEVSADTRTLVEQYLETDPELAKIAQRLTTTKLLEDIPVPLAQEDEMKTFEEAKRLLLLRTIGLAVVISLPLLCIMGMVLLALFTLSS
jgi:anti-sigma factor RsiW